MTFPDSAMLGNWILSWIQTDGAIHGFHNHSVWGGNPYRWSDFTAGHSTWASPFLAGMSHALAKQPHAEGAALLSRLIQFQTSSFQPDGQYAHIGFQVGELLNFGLIHNAITNLSLGLAALNGREYLPDADIQSIRQAVLKNMEACQRYGGGRATHNATANQDYARLWGKLVFQQAFDDRRWYDEIPQDLDFMIEHFHVGGFPDDECVATYRSLNDLSAVEPAEYYGLMICPLVMAYEVYGDQKYLDQAGRICRHVARSAWQDERGHIRFHRMWYQRDGHWIKNRQPMLIAGMGDSLEGIHAYLQHMPDPELEHFLKRCDETYAHYQNARGYFASATGWQSEVDIAPSTAWHAHDFRYLTRRQSVDTAFWERFFAPYEKMSVLLGDQCLWFEYGDYWQIRDYFWQDVYALLGRKDEVTFGRDMVWIGGDRALPVHYQCPDAPVFLRTDDAIYLVSGDEEQIDLTSVAALPYRGKS
ncbi:MAG: hypothetical protein CL610_27750 [Anaerolineaceae bacterium]|nr:hypothetical protein [Anaerolineaceae bacterium]